MGIRIVAALCWLLVAQQVFAQVAFGDVEMQLGVFFCVLDHGVKLAPGGLFSFGLMCQKLDI
jgi:hypothetical protein